jgi:aromatic ring-opening dioxygenase LigB subunit
MHSPQNKSEAKYSTYLPKNFIKRRNVSSPFLTSQHCLQPCIHHDELSEQQNSSIPVITNEVCLNTSSFLLFSFGLLVPVWFVQNDNIVQNSKSECLRKNITWSKLVVDGIQSDIRGFYSCD